MIRGVMFVSNIIDMCCVVFININDTVWGLSLAFMIPGLRCDEYPVRFVSSISDTFVRFVTSISGMNFVTSSEHQDTKCECLFHHL